MYQLQAPDAVLKQRRERGLHVSRNVVLLGTVSLLTDISAEMVATVLPIYAVVALGASPLAVGVIDGIYQGAAAIVHVGAGFVSDRWRRHKEVAASGYGLSAVCKVALLAAGSTVGALAAIVAVDRVGKGIRTAPRDALISLSSTKERLATAFGVHRAMDTAGAMLGPLIAFALLMLAPGRFDAVFVVSLCFAVLGLAVLVLTVSGRPARTRRHTPPRLGAAFGLMRERRFRSIVLAGGGLALATVSDAFVYLGLQRQLDFDTAVFPLLFVATAAAYMLLSVPVARLADRAGRVPVLIGGHVALLIVYSSLLLPSIGYAELVVYLVFLGAFYAATDGVLMALASAVLPEHLRASGLGLVLTATGLARLASSIVFGAVWAVAGIEAAAIVFAAGLAAAVLVAAPVLVRSQGAAAGA